MFEDNDGEDPDAPRNVVIPNVKACPFCGSIGKVSFYEQLGYFFAQCTDTESCQVMAVAGPFKTADEARFAWNERHSC